MTCIVFTAKHWPRSPKNSRVRATPSSKSRSFGSAPGRPAPRSYAAPETRHSKRHSMGTEPERGNTAMRALEGLMKGPMSVMAAPVNDLLLHPTTFASTHASPMPSSKERCSSSTWHNQMETNRSRASVVRSQTIGEQQCVNKIGIDAKAVPGLLYPNYQSLSSMNAPS